jgi:hypothetical protein
VVIFDPDKIAPQMPTLEHDLPAGARRLKQKADGIKAMIVNGEVLMRNNEHTGHCLANCCVVRWPIAHRWDFDGLLSGIDQILMTGTRDRIINPIPSRLDLF